MPEYYLLKQFMAEILTVGIADYRGLDTFRPQVRQRRRSGAPEVMNHIVFTSLEWDGGVCEKALTVVRSRADHTLSRRSLRFSWTECWDQQQKAHCMWQSRCGCAVCKAVILSVMRQGFQHPLCVLNTQEAVMSTWWTRPVAQTNRVLNSTAGTKACRPQNMSCLFSV